jgi:hypothetical protein
MWLTDGSAEGAPADPESPRPGPSDLAENADPLLADMPPMPGTSYVAGNQDPSFRGGQEFSGPPEFSGSQEGPFTGQQIAYGGPDVPFSPAPTAETAGQDAPYSPPGAEAPPGNGDGSRSPSYQPPIPPLPSQVAAPPASAAGAAGAAVAGVAGKVSAQFSSLTKPKVKKKPARPTRPGPRPPARVAAPSYQGRPAERMAPPRPAAARTPANAPTRRAQLVLARIEPWSVMKFSFLVSLVGFVILFVAVAALYFVLSKLGVFHSIQSTISDVTSSDGSPGSDASGQWFSAPRILGYTMIVGAVNVVLITAMATVGAVIYNLATHMAGGVEVTLKETD